jgi:AcrR family transcriptional regulator
MYANLFRRLSSFGKVGAAANEGRVERCGEDAFMAISRKDHLVETALDLFYRHGFHATGIDRILAESGVAKMTLYKHFKSKEDLILAALRLRDERFRAWFRAEVENRTRSPRKRLLTIFDVLEEWFGAVGFQGDMFINAAAEYGDLAHPIHAAAADHKTAMRRYFLDLAGAAGARDAELLADQLALLVDGAIAAAHVGGNMRSARHARRIAKLLLRNADV